MIRLALVLALTLLSANQASAEKAKKSEDSPYYTVPAGSKLLLHKPLTVPASKAGVYFQGGKVLSHKDVDEYYPHCKLEVRDVKDTPQSIEPDEFVVYKVVEGEDYSALAYPRLAGLGIISAGNGAGRVMYFTNFYLRSDKQPHVMLLICQHWEDPTDAEYLTVRQIRKALGEFFTLKLAE